MSKKEEGEARAGVLPDEHLTRAAGGVGLLQPLLLWYWHRWAWALALAPAR
jgi:hypothetical protein